MLWVCYENEGYYGVVLYLGIIVIMEFEVLKRKTYYEGYIIH
jgi:hypothetical protein